MAWTLWFNFFVLAPLLITWWRWYQRAQGWEPLSSQAISITMPEGATLPSVSIRVVDPREGIYDLAILFFTTAMIEELMHLFYCQVQTKITWSLYAGLVVALIPNGLGLLFTSFVWQKLRDSRAMGPVWRPVPEEVQEILFGLVVTVSIVTFAILTAVLRTGLVVALLVGSCMAFFAAWFTSYEFRKDFGKFLYEVGWKDLGTPSGRHSRSLPGLASCWPSVPASTAVPSASWWRGRCASPRSGRTGWTPASGWTTRRHPRLRWLFPWCPEFPSPGGEVYAAAFCTEKVESIRRSAPDHERANARGSVLFR